MTGVRTHSERGECNLGASLLTVMNWKARESKEISVATIPKISTFLRYNPEPRQDTVGELIK
jgi:hypothetical protein